MADPRKDAFATTSKTIIKNLERAGMEGYFCETSADARELVKSLVPEGSSIAWGGTETFKETDVKEMLEAGAYTMLDRRKSDHARRAASRLSAALRFRFLLHERQCAYAQRRAREHRRQLQPRGMPLVWPEARYCARWHE